MVKRALNILLITITLALFSQMLANLFRPNAILVDFIDIGQGDAALISTQGGRNIMIDSGKTDNADDLLKYLQDKYIQKIDVATISHYDDDHAGGLLSVLENYNVDLLILPYPESEEETAVHDSFLDKNATVVYAKQGDKLNIGDNLEIEVLYQDPDGSDSNSRSIVLEAEIYSKIFIFTGDIAIEQEEEIVQQNPELEANVVKVAHHGSKYSSGEVFYNSLMPQFAVISVGKNSYGHPTQEAMRRISAVGAEILRTDELGTIEFQVSENSLELARTY